MIVQKCIEMKADIVTQDEKESGLRQILNFGHTIGHALEKILNYGTIAHGEAVWYGMIAATKLSYNRRLLSRLDCNEILSFLKISRPAPPIPVFPHPRDIIQSIQSDKKTNSGKPCFVLLSEIGKTLIVDDITKEEITAVFPL